MKIVVVPMNDSKPHDEYSTTCRCDPRVMFENGEMIIIHNAFDGRHYEEQMSEILIADAEKDM